MKKSQKLKASSKKVTLKTVNKSTFKNKTKQRREPLTKHARKRGVVYLSHIPHGFYEDQIKKYFDQFGTVTNVSVPKSKGGRIKGFAFIEFKHPDVAEIAAETMNNYLMFNRLLKAKYIPPKEQKPSLFVAAKQAKVTHTTIPEKAANFLNQNRLMKNRHLKEDAEVKLASKLLKKNETIRKNLEKLGIGCDFQVKQGDIDSLLKKKKEVLKKKKEEIKKKKKEKKKKENKKVTIVSKTNKKAPGLEDEEDSSSSGE